MTEGVYQNQLKLNDDLEKIIKDLESKLRTNKNGIRTKTKHRITFQKSQEVQRDTT